MEILNDIWINRTYCPNDNFKIKDNYTVIDIGAHIGLFSIFAYKSAKNVRMFSYEPMKKSFEVLKKSIKLNKADVKAFNLGILGESCKRKLHMNSFGINPILGIPTEINCITLEDIFKRNKIERCHFLKIDTDGSEYEILLNTPRKYFKKIDLIAIECHPHPKYDYKDIINMLSHLNFEYIISGGPMSFCMLYFKKIKKKKSKNEI